MGKNLTRRFQRGKKELILAINDSDIDIQAGKVTMIMGPSGSGKSTLLNVLSGLDKPTEGRVIFDDQNIVDWDEEQLAQWRRSSVGFVFQTFELIPALTAIENVMLPLMPDRKMKTQDIRLEALSLLKQVGIFDTTNERAVKLSGGEQQRVGIARALITRPSVIFADEPTGSVDEDTGRKVMDLLIRQTRGHDRAVLFVSHNPDLKRYADNIYAMRQGKLTKEK